MTTYFDSSALLKLVISEAGSDRIRAFTRQLIEDGGEPSSSWLGESEFRRAGLRRQLRVAQIEATIADFQLFEMPREVFEQASRIPGIHLRTLDALHVAVAIRARAAHFVTYDRRQGEAAATLGLNVVSP